MADVYAFFADAGVCEIEKSRVIRRHRDVFSTLSTEKFVERFRISKDAVKGACLAVERDFAKGMYFRHPECCCFLHVQIDVVGAAIMLYCNLCATFILNPRERIRIENCISTDIAV